MSEKIDIKDSLTWGEVSQRSKFKVDPSLQDENGESIAPNPTTLTTTVDGQTQTWTGLDINTRGNVTITNPGQAFQFVETYRSPSLSNVTTINRTTVLESTTETTSVFSQ